ncbi:MAG: zinc-dependent alcohol dehydrogenase family protein [Alphaproteobacteria bacterium]|nr:zinc-dependent alcohol dehydrogenase family protein [Alphaproteobacteria bacterium]
MKAVELMSVGPAPEVVRCIEVDEPGAPGVGEIIVELAACSINPADLMIFEGNYAAIPETPCPIGIEGAGIVMAVGDGVSLVGVGDKVMSLYRANWSQQLRLKETEVVRLPDGIDLEQAAMLKVNAATALLMLKKYVDLVPGDWVIQDAANSGVGKNLIRLASEKGYKTINVVRREELIAPLTAMGGDVVILDGEDLAERVSAATGGAKAKLAIDCISGAITMRLADCLADGSIVINYGQLTDDPCMLRPDQVFFRDIRLMGFWLAKMMPTMTFDEIVAMYQELADRVVDGTLEVAVEATYPLERIKDAVAHAGRYKRDGKILLRPNG